MAYIDQQRYIEYMKMDTMDGVDNITKNIVREILRTLTKTGNVLIEENFCIYFVQLYTLLDPKWGITGECQLNRDNVSKLVNFCIETLQQQDSPFVKNVMIQHLWMSRPQTRRELISSYRNAVKEKVEPLRQDILNFQMDEDSKQFRQKCAKKIVLYTILNNGLGNPSDAQILNEATNALGSVFKDKDIIQFCGLENSDKSTQLGIINDLVCGIRIFNEKSGKTSSGILDFINILQDAVKITLSEVRKILDRIMERIDLLTLILEDSQSGIGSDIVLNKEECDPDHVSLLIAFRQTELFLRKLLKEVEEIDKNTTTLDSKFEMNIANLNKILKYKVAMTAQEVYPIFFVLAHTIFQIQDEAILLKKYNTIFTGLVKLTKEINYDSDKLRKLVNRKTIVSDETRLEKTNSVKIKLYNSKCLILHLEDPSSVKLQYLGFCPWFLVQTNGGLMPGNPKMGILKCKTNYYIFSSAEGAAEFAKDPDRYILQIMDIARNRTDLVHFLQLSQELLAVRDIPTLYKKPSSYRVTEEVAVQTVLHPVESNIDKDYRWNIWDMYKDAIRWSNIKKCQTHSTQTLHSTWKSPAKVQTIEYRSKIMQTKRDNYTNVPTLSNYIFGLRGRKDDKIEVIDLTRPIDE